MQIVLESELTKSSSTLQTLLKNCIFISPPKITYKFSTYNFKIHCSPTIDFIQQFCFNASETLNKRRFALAIFHTFKTTLPIRNLKSVFLKSIAESNFIFELNNCTNCVISLYEMFPFRSK